MLYPNTLRYTCTVSFDYSLASMPGSKLGIEKLAKAYKKKAKLTSLHQRNVHHRHK